MVEDSSITGRPPDRDGISAKRSLAGTAGIVIILATVPVLLISLGRREWLQAAYSGVIIVYGALHVWLWPFASKPVRAVLIVVVVTSLILATAVLLTEFA